MGIAQYGVLKGRTIARRFGHGRKPHYQLHVIAGDDDFRVSINIGSDSQPTDLVYTVDDQFRHPLTHCLGGLEPGFTALRSQAGGAALDYIRGNLFDPSRLQVLPAVVPGPDNDLNERLDRYIQRVMADEEAWVYAFGSRWGPERQRDDYFGFRPGNGIHNVHMNQGNNERHRDEDGVWQDGGLVLHFPVTEQWVAIFLAFQSQTWHTDDRTGRRFGGIARPAIATRDEAIEPMLPPEITASPYGEEPIVRIVAALVNPRDAQETETVTLLNTAPEPLDLAGWAILDRFKGRHALNGIIAPGATMRVTLSRPVQLGNDGGIISLVDASGLKVHGVSYIARQAARAGWTIVF